MFKKIFAVAVLVAIPTFSHSTQTLQAGKTYELINLKQVVSNSDKCGAIFQSLKTLAKKPFTLQFAAAGASKHAATHVGSEAKNHTNTIAKQASDGNKFQRTSMGSMELNGEKVDYVMEVSANLDNSNHQHLYPAILSGDAGQCYYTALVKPDEKTVASFKKSITAGHAAKGVDLQKHH